MFSYPTYHPEFYTATVLEWKRLLQPEKYKQLIVKSLHFLVQEKRAVVNAFVIMDSHLHLIWQAKPGYKPSELQHSFLKYTAQQIKFDLQTHHPKALIHFKVDARDREYQFWERNSLGIELYNEAVFLQKLNYVHSNPVSAGLCKLPEEYKYSSAKFYETGVDDFGFLQHYRG